MKFTPYLQCWTKFWAKRTDGKANRLTTMVLLAILFLPSIDLLACVVSCKISLSVSLDQNGEAMLTPLILLQDPSCNPADFTVNITDPSGNSVGNTLTCDHVGLTMTATVTQTATGNSCSTTIFVSDNIRPNISCSDTTILCIQSADPAVIGYPQVNDNCTDLTFEDLTYSDDFTDLACFSTNGSDSITSQIERTWTVTDAYGNEETCIQMIYLRRATIDLVEFPPHLDGFANPALGCGQDPEDLSLTGEPTINGIPIDNGGNCELVSSKSDQIIPLCGSGGYRILRTWTVADYCGNDFDLQVQVIKVEDTTPPVLNCPADQAFGTNTYTCDASVTLPAASATDDCSTFTIETSWAFGTGLGPFTEVPTGEYPVTYTATDACGNSSSCTINVSITDDVAPISVCNGLLEVNLSYLGTALVYASSFDNGSHDNCALDTILVSRNGTDFSGSVLFDCADLAETLVPVHVRVIDVAGNYNECSVYVDVDDKLNPVISCPANLNLSCDKDYTDLTLTGEPVVTDNCTIDSVSYEDTVDLNDCGEGTVTRIWTVVDTRGNSSSCVQFIYLVDSTPLQVYFPDNYSSSVCGANTDPSITGEPILVNDNCEQVNFIHTDDTVGVSTSCYVIFRTWKVYEWCTYDPNGDTNEGYWTDTQVITITDDEAPVITCPADITANLFTADCSGTYVNVLPAFATDCDTQLSITNDSPYADAAGENASGTYPPGIHIINFYATDGCNNSATCSMQITVVDAKAPTAICTGGVNVDLMENGTVTISPELINYGSFDNCTSPENLVITVSPDSFDCTHLGEQTVTLTVTDETGNSSTCTTTVNIQDNNFACSNSSYAMSGAVLSEAGVPLQGVEFFLSGDVADTLTCDETGTFSFPEVPAGGAYTVTPYKNTDADNGVSTFDIIFIQRHILDIQALSTPYKMIAADVNRSGSVSGFDIVLLRRVILQIDTTFSSTTSWRFVDASYVFPDLTNPFSSVFPESIIVENLSADENGLEFIGIKTGDVNGSANPAQGVQPVEARSESAPLVLSTPDQQLQAGERVRIPIYADNLAELLGYQLSLQVDTTSLSIEEVEAGSLPGLNTDNFGKTFLTEGILHTNWVKNTSMDNWEKDSPIFYLHLLAKENTTLEHSLELSPDHLRAEAYNEYFEVMDLVLEFTTPSIAEEKGIFDLHNFPNPMQSHTWIEFSLDTPSTTQLKIYDMQGRMVFSRSRSWERGEQQWKLDRTDLPESGMYIYELSLADGRKSTSKLIVH